MDVICPMIIFGTIGFYSFCLDQQPTYQFNDCWESQNYATSIAFDVEISPTYIEVNSDFAYTNCPMCNVWSNAIITDGCNGEIVWSTEGCGQDLVVNSFTQFGGFDIIPNLAGENWWVELDLPVGSYVMHTVAIGTSDVGQYMTGCMDVTIISGLLGLEVVEYKTRTIHQGREYDYLGRLINTFKLN